MTDFIEIFFKHLYSLPLYRRDGLSQEIPFFMIPMVRAFSSWAFARLNRLGISRNITMLEGGGFTNNILIVSLRFLSYNIMLLLGLVEARSVNAKVKHCQHQIQSEYGDEQADAGRDCRTRLARPISQARNSEIFIFSVQLTTSRIGNLTRLMLFLLYVMAIHTYTHTTLTCSS